VVAIAVVSRRLQRLWAIVLVLGLLAPAPLLARGGCTVCPSDCPMHEPQASDTVGCHRSAGAAAPAAAGGRPCELRRACGHDRDGAPVVEVKAASRPRAPVMATAMQAADPWTVVVVASNVPEVPTGPPKRARV
jgi:hypothetical protein